MLNTVRNEIDKKIEYHMISEANQKCTRQSIDTARRDSTDKKDLNNFLPKSSGELD